MEIQLTTPEKTIATLVTSNNEILNWIIYKSKKNGRGLFRDLTSDMFFLFGKPAIVTGVVNTWYLKHGNLVFCVNAVKNERAHFGCCGNPHVLTNKIIAFLEALNNMIEANVVEWDE